MKSRSVIVIVLLAIFSVLITVIVSTSILISNTANQNSEPMACTADAKICPDGSAVGRDGTNNCKFFDCPVSQSAGDNEMIFCTQDVGMCADGSYVSRDGKRGCAFQLCPDGKQL